jgi:preprotein translocase subunit SecF
MKMFHVFPVNSKIPFMKFRIPTLFVSIVAVTAAIYCLSVKGLNYGVDFAGGVEIVLAFPKDSGATSEKLRASLKKMGIEDASVQAFGTEFEARESEYMVHFSSEFTQAEKAQAKIEKAFSKKGSPQGYVKSFRFSGMEKAYLKVSDAKSIKDIRSTLNGVDFGILELLEVQPFGSETSHEYQVSFRTISSILKRELPKDFKSASGEKLEVKKVDFVGAKVGKDLKVSALMSILITILLVFVYIFMRFDLIYSPGVVVALAHDVIITAGLFSFFGFEFDLTTVAALLTLAGYSINDTIIVYDRIREVAASLKGKRFASIIDIAINQTMSRTIITTGTTLFASAVLWTKGGPVIHGFAFALSAGILVGTYSSIFVASPMILWSEKWYRKRENKQKKKAA